MFTLSWALGNKSENKQPLPPNTSFLVPKRRVYMISKKIKHITKNVRR